jgi:hypothetical protein
MEKIIHVVGIFIGLLILNEIFRRSKWLSLIVFVGIAGILTFTVWPTAGDHPDATINTWFHWAKVYSAIAGVLIFAYIRYSKSGASNKNILFLPALILGVNILEAVLRDFELGGENGGIWHYLNGSAGILSIITISGWVGINVTKDKSQDMIWPDMLVFWIIAYDIWNFAYIYFCVPEHTFYNVAVLFSCTVPALFITKGSWLQARAITLSAWMMYLFTFNSYVDSPERFIMPSNNETIMLIVGIISFGANAAFAWIHFSKMFKEKRFGFGQEVHVN